MPSQPVPEPTDSDVRRVVLRDFGAEQVDVALSIVEEFGKQDWNEPSPRVRLAILKIAKGDIDRLREATQMAISDYRDVLSAAEYPRYMREVGFSNLSSRMAQAIIDADWKQYCEWLDQD